MSNCFDMHLYRAILNILQNHVQAYFRRSVIIRRKSYYVRHAIKWIKP